MFDVRDCLVCGRCKPWIHRANVPNSISGQVICCGAPMRGPYDPAVNITLALALLLGVGEIYALVKHGWGGWSAFFASAGTMIVVWLPIGFALFGWIDRRFWRKK